MVGHSIECRIVPEPETFVPSPGKITTFNLRRAGVRVDTYVYPGISRRLLSSLIAK
jgi:biotin carboxylase